MLSPWIIHTLTLPPLLASLVPRNFRRYHKPTIYLPQNSHHTYLLWHFHSDRGKGVPSFDEMMDFALVEVDFDDPTTNGEDVAP